MSHDLQRVTLRIAKQMASLRDSQVPKDPKGLAVFMGLGLALGMCYEQGTGKSFQQEKPTEILKWALSLRDEVPQKVRLT